MRIGKRYSRANGASSLADAQKKYGYANGLCGDAPETPLRHYVRNPERLNRMNPGSLRAILRRALIRIGELEG